ncbi:response regulator transcription factor [Flavobacterium franklandianum]|uniref:Response regulator transcription factor n=1 Tax=Flavobacterium franklandianum TaxID=2594430 RepID=A0A553CJ07_9FLAO|nr:LytTR family transcriptional regulator DNA-binding domain-containing protein [Flavobacterium franklandianum]TRX20485.1 response regulator transcription factor [Flavobacterium franklandianum]TRX24802.1 response regulator transcription factor [Flavobacterium franklandianum]
MTKNNTILIVEDEMIIAANISLQLTHLGYEVTGIIPRAEEVLPHIRLYVPDILLLDINLKGDIDGIQLALLIQKEFKIPIIYLTANSDEAHFERAKDTNPYAFISKPFKKLDLQHAIELTIIRIQNENETEKSIPIDNDVPFVLSDCIFVRSHNKMVKVCINDILFIEAERNYCKIHCKDREHLLVTTLKDLEEKLTSNNLLRIHRSFIVNLSHIDEIAMSHVVIAKKAIPLSAELKKKLLQRIQKI